MKKRAFLRFRAFQLFLKTSKYGGLAFFLAIIILGGLTVWAFVPEGKIETLEMYPAKVISGDSEGSASGDGWSNLNNALGRPEVFSDAKIENFSNINSATYKAGASSLIVSGFGAEDQDASGYYENKKFKSAQVKFSFAMGEKKADLEIQTPANKLPEEESFSGTKSELTPEISPKPSFTPESSIEPSVSTEPSIKPSAPPESFIGPVIETPSSELLPEPTMEITPTPTLAPELTLEPMPIPTLNIESNSLDKNSFLEKFKNLFTVQSVKADENKENFVNNFKDETSYASPEAVSSFNDAGKLPNIDDKIIVWYSFDNEIWWKLNTISGSSLSNNLNGGYFSFDAPLVKSWDDLKNLKIKFEGVVGGQTEIVSYLDSVWVEASYARVEKDNTNSEEKNSETDNNSIEIKSISSKKDFKRWEEPELKFHYKKNKGLSLLLARL